MSHKLNVRGRGTTILLVIGAVLTAGMLLAAANLFDSTADHSLSCTLSTVSFYGAFLLGLFMLAVPITRLLQGDWSGGRGGDAGHGSGDN